MGRRLGLCSWSLRPASPAELATHTLAVGVAYVQLALDPLRSGRWKVETTLAALRESGISVASGMMEMLGEDYGTLDSIRETGGVRSDENWGANLAAARDNAALAHRLGLDLVTLHAGFIPHEAGDPLRRTMLDRVRALADVFAEQGVRLGLETGQETAATLQAALEELAHDNVGVNFDPANMILYGMGDPVAALEALSPHVFQIHVKDALPTTEPGTWGEEVVVGSGAVDWSRFFQVVRDRQLTCDLMIEREAGDDRIQDMASARAVVANHIEVDP